MTQALALVTRELAMFAAAGLLLGGIDDILFDLLWIGRAAGRRLTAHHRSPPVTAATLPAPDRPGRLAVFVAAWDEAAVIGAMLRAALGRFDHADYRIYVGTYANDPATRAAVRAIADPRIRLVTGDVRGPTTKAECLNRCWQALCRDERAAGARFKAVLIHDAEDVVHPLELRVVDRLIERYDFVQLPVLPLIQPWTGGVSGHYADEFAELHGRRIPLRQALGAGIPAAGTGCALGRDVLEHLAEQGGGVPFDASSVTEDYEIGLRLAQLGARSAFVAMPAAPGAPPVAVRAYFPAKAGDAVRQKTRWLIGIACAGWDRLGWQGGPVERWMRLRDRTAILAALVLAAAYLSFALAGVCRAADVAVDWPRWFAPAVRITTGMLVWRLAIRFAAVRRFYGLREGLWSVPRTLTANIILIFAAARAILLYVPGVVPRWDKTAHRFPDASSCG